MNILGILLIMVGLAVGFFEAAGAPTVMQQIAAFLLGGFICLSGVILCVGGAVAAEIKTLREARPRPEELKIKN